MHSLLSITTVNDRVFFLFCCKYSFLTWNERQCIFERIFAVNGKQSFVYDKNMINTYRIEEVKEEQIVSFRNEKEQSIHMYM